MCPHPDLHTILHGTTTVQHLPHIHMCSVIHNNHESPLVPFPTQRRCQPSTPKSRHRTSTGSPHTTCQLKCVSTPTSIFYISPNHQLLCPFRTHRQQRHSLTQQITLDITCTSILTVTFIFAKLSSSHDSLASDQAMRMASTASCSTVRTMATPPFSHYTLSNVDTKIMRQQPIRH